MLYCPQCSSTHCYFTVSSVKCYDCGISTIFKKNYTAPVKPEDCTDTLKIEISSYFDLLKGLDKYREFMEDPPEDYAVTPLMRGSKQNLGAWSKQIGGTHYQDLAIQPMTYSMKNGLNALAHSIVKYATRAGRKGDKEDHLKDVDKIIHCAQMLKEYLEDE